MARWLPPLISALLLAAAASGGARAASSSVNVFPRRVGVPDLTADLLHQLETHNVSVLLVLPGPHHQTSMQLDFERLSAQLERLSFIHSPEDFRSKVHSLYRHHRWASQQQQQQQQLGGSRGGLPYSTQRLAAHPVGTGARGSGSDYDPQAWSPGGHPSSLRAALLVRAQDGAVGVGALGLASFVSHGLRHAHVLTFSYSKHRFSSDSLLTLAPDGTPLSASFVSTAVFRDAFSEIYDKKVWGSGASGGGGSGEGSSEAYTRTVRRELPRVIARHRVGSMLDSSCGSMFWMPAVLEEVEKANPKCGAAHAAGAGLLPTPAAAALRLRFNFMGTDVACSMISRHQRAFAANHTNWRFACVDYGNQKLPSGYELVFSRDSLQHLPMHGAWNFLNNVKASGAKWLLVGSYVNSTDANSNIPAPGHYYPVDLLKPPFSASPPLEVIDEGTPDGKHLLLFDVAALTWSDTLDGLV